MTLQLRAIEVPPAHASHEPPYRLFLGGSLALAVGVGFLLALLLPLAGALEWDWGIRWYALAQVHGQVQLLGFAGLFTAGMTLRLMPRFSGRPLALRGLVPWVLATIAGGLLLRLLAQPLSDSGARDVLLYASAALTLAGAGMFGTSIWGTLAHLDSKAASTGYFFLAGAAAFVAAAVLNVFIVHEMARDGLALAPGLKQTALTTLEEYGFVLMFLCGVATRAVPTLRGQPRRDLPATAACIALAGGVALFSVTMLRMAYSGPSAGMARTADVGLLLIAVAFAIVVGLSGVFWPNPNRVAAASQTQFWFVRAAMTWLLISAALLASFALRKIGDGQTPDQFHMDAVRHATAIGVILNMILGMAMLVVPEFAGRRLQHPDERWLVIAMVVAVNVAAALRIWPALEGTEWLETTRNWPMAAAGSLALLVIAAFGAMFAQSWWEQRSPGWARPEALAARRSGQTRGA